MYKIVLDDWSADDLRQLQREKKTIRVACDELLTRISLRPKSYKQLRPPLKGFRKAKFGGNDFRVIFSTDDHRKAVFIIAIGSRQNIYEKVMMPIRQKE